MNTGNISEIISLFRKENDSRPNLLIGAGSSFNSGIPLAAAATKRIAKASYVKQTGRSWKNFDRVNVSEWEPYLKMQDWFAIYNNNLAEAFPAAVENFLNPKEFRKEFLIDMLEQKIPISIGYKSLAKLLHRNLCWTVFTTNFDTLISDSFRENAPGKRIVEINRTSEDLRAFRIYNQRQIVYLHGAVEYYTDKIEQGETKILSEELVSKIRPCIGSGPLIIIGYRGAEQSIMKHLLLEGKTYCNNYTHGIYWCILKNEEPHSYVKEFANAINNNFRLVEIDGSDELLTKIDSELNDEYYLNSDYQLTLDNSLSFDEQIIQDKTYDDIDEDLVKLTLSKYFERLSISSVGPENYKDFLISEHFLIKKEGILHPTNACYLLFGKKIVDKFPFAVITFEIDDKSRTVFDGNLIEQFNKIQDYFKLNTVNPIIRIKKEKESIEIKAYEPTAIRELLVNMLVHRDYSVNEYARIENKSGQQISFSSPGSLLNHVRKRIKLDEMGYFEPVRGLSQIRNKLIADIFYGIGTMDKLGSGMPDVKEYMRDSGGEAKFKINKNNSLTCSLLQAFQLNPQQDRIAKPLLKSELYITNLIPFQVMPEVVYLFPVLENLSFMEIVRRLPKSNFLPIYLTDIHTNVIDKKLISFANLEFYREKFENVLDFAKSQSMNLEKFILNKDQKNRIVWLILKHFEIYLNNFKNYGLHVEYKDKRAYFELISGIENKITYLSRMNRKVHRAVVKRRETKTKTFHENEGISFGLEYLGGKFSLSIKPIYMFTKKDGKTPMENYLRSRYSTSRMKFDRNKNVDDDLHFWLKFISQGRSSINIGGYEIDNLILDTSYIESEVIIEDENVLL